MDVRWDWLVAFLVGVLSVTVAAYVFWQKNGQPPFQP